MKKMASVIMALLMYYLLQAQNDTPDSLLKNNLKIYPVIWQQSAAEYRALCYQAFNIATLRLNEALQKNHHTKNLAVITDLDETILDNSNITAQTIKSGKNINYNEWLKWLNKPGLPTVPGGVEFLQYAAGKGITIFYISNRNASGMQITVAVLQKLNLPDADSNHILLLSNTSSKEPRRQNIMHDYDVLMLLGDNLDDFAQVFENKPVNERFAETDAAKNKWGKKFIVLPNATYGDWENEFYNDENADGLSGEQKTNKLKALLKGFDDSKTIY